MFRSDDPVTTITYAIDITRKIGISFQVKHFASLTLESSM